MYLVFFRYGVIYLFSIDMYKGVLNFWFSWFLVILCFRIFLLGDQLVLLPNPQGRCRSDQHEFCTRERWYVHNVRIFWQRKKSWKFRMYMTFAGKLWFSIDRNDNQKFCNFLQEFSGVPVEENLWDILVERKCVCPYRHKFLWIHPIAIMAAGITVHVWFCIEAKF